MTKKLLTSFIIYLIFAGIIIMLRTTAAYFNGVGVGFVALLGLLAASIVLTNIDKHVANRTKDLLIVSSIFTIWEFLVYFIVEYGVGTFNTITVFLGIQNVLSFIAIFFFAYIVLRLIADAKNAKLGLIEALLGNGEKKQKKSREFENGSLEEKPINKEHPKEEMKTNEQETENNFNEE